MEPTYIRAVLHLWGMKCDASSKTTANLKDDRFDIQPGRRRQIVVTATGTIVMAYVVIAYINYSLCSYIVMATDCCEQMGLKQARLLGS